MAKYKIFFECVVTIEAENAAKAIQEAWLIRNLNKATYKYLDCKKVDG